MRKVLGVNPRSPLLMFLAVRSGKSCKKRPLRMSGFPACSLGLRVLFLLSPHCLSYLWLAPTESARSEDRLPIESTHVHLQ